MHYIESDTLMFVSVIILLGWIIWLQFRKRQQQTELRKLQLQFVSEALTKSPTTTEFVSFLQSKEGLAMLSDGQGPANGRSRTNIRIVQLGTLLAFVGVGFFFCAARYHGTPDKDLQDVLAMLNFTGTLAISSGIGLYAVATVAYLWERWCNRSTSE
jgi:preprotein translocase subunit YajC